MALAHLGQLMPQEATALPPQPTTPPQTQTPQNGAHSAPQRPAAALPLALCPELRALVAAGLEQQQGRLLLGLLAQCGRDTEGVRWKLVLGDVRLEPEG